MSGTTWTKFYWSDWETDPALKLCSLAAQGLWMRMLCIAASHDPIGYVCVAGRPLGVTDLARLTGASETEVGALFAELVQNGVCSRDRTDRIYNRRMVRAARKSAECSKNGKLGGNPNLGNRKGNSSTLKPPLMPGVKPQEPRASKKVEALQASNLLSGQEDLNLEGKRGDFRQAVVELKGEEYARAWLDRNRWQDIPEPAIVCKLGFTAKRLSGDLKALLKTHGVTVRVEAAA